MAVVLASHGSKALGFDSAMKRVVAALRREKKFKEVCCAFLEVAQPSISEAIDQCVERGAKEVRVLPYFVLTGKHVVHDIPQIVREAASRHAHRAKIVLCPYLGYDPKIVSVAKQRLKEKKL